MEISRVPGSFRDPSGHVFTIDGRIFRAIDGEFAGLWDRIEKSPVLARLRERKSIVETERVAQDSPEHREARAAFPAFEHFLRHEAIDPISYPYEWSRGMLADAAVHCLDLQMELVGEGYSLKDASAFNVQFRGPRPVFIDITSFEVPVRRDLWIALAQFQRMFLFPLLLWRHRRIDHKGYFLSHIDGMDPDRIYGIFGGLASLKPSLVLDVGLPHWLGGMANSKKDDLQEKVRKSGGNPAGLLANLKRIRSKVVGLGRHRASGHWKDYADDNSYSGEAEEAKVRFIKGFMDEFKPPRVLDLGSNTGKFSRIAAEGGARVIAVDGDHDCIDNLYQSVKSTPLDILPLWADLANPSPGLGFRNRERAPLLERIRADAVFALALLHHLLITSRLPLEEIRDLFRSLARRHLVIEFVERTDPMFKALLGLREDIYGDLTTDRFVACFEERFRLIRRERLPGTDRELMLFETGDPA